MKNIMVILKIMEVHIVIMRCGGKEP